MSEILHKTTVLVLNRNWQAIHTKTPAQAFCMMATDVATALDIQGDGAMTPVKWKEWLALPVREGDNAVLTTHGPVRAPTVLVLANYAKVPKSRPKFSPRNIWKRDGGRCQYTGQALAPEDGNIDHVLPRSRGGATSWENCVLSHKAINSRKANKLPGEAGLTLLRTPAAPRDIPATVSIGNTHQVPDWSFFLKG